MNNKKCPNCGFINFLQAESCSKCETTLEAPGPLQQPDYATEMPGHHGGRSYSNPYRPPARKNSGGFPVVKVLLSLGALLVVTLVICVVLGVAYLRRSPSIAWREFRPGEPGLSIMMPDEPIVMDPVVTPTLHGDMKNYVYTAMVPRQGGVTFCMVVLPFNVATYNIPPHKILDKEMESFLKRTNSKAVSNSSIREGGLDGLSFEFKPTDSGKSRIEKGFGKMILGTNRIYFLSIVAAEKSELLESKDKFLNASIPY